MKLFGKKKIKLGDRVKDKITGFTGIVTGTHQFLTGCDKCTVQPEKMVEGKVMDSLWFDTQQLILLKPEAISLDNGITPGGPMKMPQHAKAPKR